MVAVLYSTVSDVQDIDLPYPSLLLEKSHKPNVIVLQLEPAIDTKLEVNDILRSCILAIPA